MSDELVSIHLPVLLEEISDHTFSMCASLEQIALPESLSTIGDAFSFSALREIVIPKKVSQISPLAFSNCKALSSVVFPVDSSVQKLSGVFGKSGLESIFLPYSIRVLDGEFTDCVNLREVIIQEGCLQISDSFANCESLQTITLPASLVSLDRSFINCSSLKDVYFYNADTQIAGMFKRSCFTGCPQVILHGYPGSTAEAFAREHSLPFEPIPVDTRFTP